MLDETSILLKDVTSNVVVVILWSASEYSRELEQLAIKRIAVNAIAYLNIFLISASVFCFCDIDVAEYGLVTFKNVKICRIVK